MEEYVITPAALRLINPRVVIHTVDENCKVFHSSAVSVFGGDHPRQWTVMTSLALVMEIDVVFKLVSAEWTEVCEFYLVTVIIKFVIFVSYSAILFFF